MAGRRSDTDGSRPRRCISVGTGARYLLWTMLDDGQEITVPLHSGLAGASVSTRAAVRVPDASLDPRFNDEVDKFTGYKTGSVLRLRPAGRRGRACTQAQRALCGLGSGSALRPRTDRACIAKFGQNWSDMRHTWWSLGEFCPPLPNRVNAFAPLPNGVETKCFHYVRACIQRDRTDRVHIRASFRDDRRSAPGHFVQHFLIFAIVRVRGLPGETS